VILSLVMEQERVRPFQIPPFKAYNFSDDCSTIGTQASLEARVKELEAYNLAQKQKLAALMQRNEFLELFLAKDQTQRDDFKKFFKARIVAENEFLRTAVSRFSPFDSIHVSHVAHLEAVNLSQAFELEDRERQISALLEQVQTLERGLLDSS